MTQKLLLALTLGYFMQSGSFGVEDAMGWNGLSEDSAMIMQIPTSTNILL